MRLENLLIEKAKLGWIRIDLIEDDLALRFVEDVNQVQVYTLLELQPAHLLLTLFHGLLPLPLGFTDQKPNLVIDLVAKLSIFAL